MTLYKIPAAAGLGGGAGYNGDDGVKLIKALRELQGLKLDLVTGNVGAATNMTMTGVAVGDTLVKVLEQDTTSGVLAVHAGTVTITAANTLRSTAVTTGKNLLVLWFHKA